MESVRSNEENLKGHPESNERGSSAKRGLRTAQCAKQIADALVESNRHEWSANPSFPAPVVHGRQRRLERGNECDKRLRLERRIRAHLPPCSISLVLTDNRYTMISVKRMTKVTVTTKL